MVGHWEKGPSSETWVVSGDSLIGIGMGIRDARTEFFEVMVIDAGDKGLTFTAMPNGLRSVNFATESLSDQAAAFRSPDNPFPKSIAYRRDGESLAVQLHGEGRPDSSFAYSPGERDPSPVLEQADRVFAADSASRGADAWADAFVPDGVLWTRNSGRVEGREAIRAAMSPVFAGGESGLEWQPTASGMSPRGDLGFTVGRYRLTRLRDGGEADTLQSGTYVSIWRRQKDGAWRVVFDTGVPD